MKDITALRIFTRVARLGSFSAAAREAGLAQSQVSRMVADLEASLGVRLLVRTTRAVLPTEPGYEYVGRIETILAALDDADNSIRESGELRGSLRVGMPSTMATRVVMPRLPAFAERHPDLQIDIILDDARQDMVREAVDVGIRVGPLPDSSGTSRRIGTMHRLVVASPDYLAKRSAPLDPDDLIGHRIVGGPAANHTNSWTFTRNGEAKTVQVTSNIRTNDTAGAIAAAASGLGITSTTDWACRSELETGSLVRLLQGWETTALPVSAYLPSGRTSRIAARAFVEFIAGSLRAEPPVKSDPAADPKERPTLLIAPD